MNYELHYNKLIERAKNRLLECYTEKHHVVPRCVGGDNSTDNLVILTAREHYVAHQLLVKMYPGHRGLAYAAICMGMNSHGNRPNNRIYGWLRKKYSETPPWNKGKTGIYSEETIEKIRAANIGKIYSKETLKKISESVTAREHTWGHKISKARTGMKRDPFSEEWKKKIGDAQRGVAQPKITCPHCDKNGGTSLMKRYHFNNCKQVAV